MTRGSGPVRSGASTRAAVDTLAALAALPPTEAEPSPATWETTNLLHLGQALSLVAHRREETRGGHVRSDFPERDDAHWLRHLTTTRSADGSLVVTEEPVGAPA
jgi:L-aspartate oxidase